jgi:sugar phosphate isomerase/epimerase
MQRVSSFPSPEAFRDALRVLADCGYEGVELNVTEPFGLDFDLLDRWTREFHLTIPSFLTGEAYFDGLCLSSPDPEVRRRTVERLIGYLDVAERFGSILVVGLLQGLRRDEPDPVVANARIRDGLRQVMDAAEKKEVDMVMEPVNHLQVGFNNSLAEVEALISAVGSPRLLPMLDTLHMNIEEVSIERTFYECQGRVRHVHLCEGNGGAFGTGPVNFLQVLRALKEIEYKGFASVKVYRHLNFHDAATSSLEFLGRQAAQIGILDADRLERDLAAKAVAEKG